MSDAVLIVQLPRGGEVDRNRAEEMPPSIANGQAGQPPIADNYGE